MDRAVVEVTNAPGDDDGGHDRGWRGRGRSAREPVYHIILQIVIFTNDILKSLAGVERFFHVPVRNILKFDDRVGGGGDFTSPGFEDVPHPSSPGDENKYPLFFPFAWQRSHLLITRWLHYEPGRE